MNHRGVPRCRSRAWQSRALPRALTLLLLAGCSDAPRRYDVSGKVSYRGEPLRAGVIFFDTDIKKDHHGPQGYALIKDGAYNTAEPGGKGTIGGPHIARIDGFDGSRARELPFGRPLFSSFHKEVDLPRATSTADFDVPAEAP